MRQQSKPHAHFAPPKLSTVWADFKQRITPASHPSTTSESAHGAISSDSYYLGGSSHSSHLPLELLDPKSHPSKLGRRKAHSGTNSRRRGNNSAGASQSRDGTEGHDGDGDDDEAIADAEPVSHIVVDNNFDHFVPRPPRSDSGSTPGTGKSDTQNGDSPDGEDGQCGPIDTEQSTISRMDLAKAWAYRIPGYTLIFERLWPNLRHFFDSSFPEQSKERSFRKEVCLCLTTP